MDDLLGRELAAMDYPLHKRDDAEFLRGVIAVGKAGFQAAMQENAALRSRLAAQAQGAEPVKVKAIYTASKTQHADKWRKLRTEGWPINSSWIDEAGVGETACFSDLWGRCVQEAQSASAVLLYREPGEVLKGAFVEAGAALACGVPVHAISCSEFSFVHHRLVTQHLTLTDALDALATLRALSTPLASEGGE